MKSKRRHQIRKCLAMNKRKRAFCWQLGQSWVRRQPMERSATTRNVIVTAAERTATHWHCDKHQLLLKQLNLTVERLEKQNKVTNLKVNKHSTVFSCCDITGCRMRGPRISGNRVHIFQQFAKHLITFMTLYNRQVGLMI